MSEVQTPQKRLPYLLEWGGQGGVQLWRWRCPVCHFQVSSADRTEVQRAADEHACGGGWCPIPARDPLPKPVLSAIPERYVPEPKKKRKPSNETAGPTGEAPPVQD